MFRISLKEFDNLRSQFVTIKNGRGTHKKYLPYAFIEQGIAIEGDKNEI